VTPTRNQNSEGKKSHTCPKAVAFVFLLKGWENHAENSKEGRGHATTPTDIEEGSISFTKGEKIFLHEKEIGEIREDKKTTVDQGESPKTWRWPKTIALGSKLL